MVFCHLPSDKPLSTKMIAFAMDSTYSLYTLLSPNLSMTSFHHFQLQDGLSTSMSTSQTSQASCASSTQWGGARMDRIAVSATSWVLKIKTSDVSPVAQTRSALLCAQDPGGRHAMTGVQQSFLGSSKYCRCLNLSLGRG